MLITTITKRSSEELTDYLLENWVKVKYLHSEIETLDRLETLKELRQWKIDVIVWVNLLREWLDLPEVSKICILDADKQWFLRSVSALIQIIWRAARNENWKVYMYSEKLKKTNIKELIKEEDWLYRLDNWKLCNEDWLIVSEAMRKAIHLTYYRRNFQDKFNKENNIIPKTVFSEIKDMWIRTKWVDYAILDNKQDLSKEIARLELEMDIAAANMEYEKAADLRDAIIWLKKGTK
jgi:excinuclease ABC subunit B